MIDVRIAPWSEDDLDLLRQLKAPEIRQHTGGPETDEQVLARHERYVCGPGPRSGTMFTVVLLPDGVKVGSVGYWERECAAKPCTRWAGRSCPRTREGACPPRRCAR
jgi:hypothetical protein